MYCIIMKFQMFAVAIIITSAFLGCIGNPPSPISSIPKAIIDYADAEFKVYIHGVDDYKYNNIKISINNSLVLNENNTRGEKVNTTSKQFSLNITVIFDKDIYQYNGNITFLNDKKIKVLEKNKEREEEIPYITFLEKIREVKK